MTKLATQWGCDVPNSADHNIQKISLKNFGCKIHFTLVRAQN